MQKGTTTVKNIQQYLMKVNQDLNKAPSLLQVDSKKAKAVSESVEKRIKQMYAEYE